MPNSAESPLGLDVMAGVVDIPAAGATDRTQLPDRAGCAYVIIGADLGNAGRIYLGGSDVTNSSGASEGFGLDPGDSVTMRINNPNVVYAAADVAGDNAEYLAQ